jgi:RNA polymerase sigma-70 factor (ECF subfamily)
MVSMGKRKTNNGSLAERAGQFAATRWSVVLAAGHPSLPDSRGALESLCRAYWHPLYAYVRRRVADPNEAQDLTQAFFAELLAKNYVGMANAQRGRFRAFLLTAFKHFLSKEWERAKAQKRGGGKAPLSLDFESADSRCRIEPTSELTADQLYEREWALTVLGQVMRQLEDEFVRSGRKRQFDELKGFLIGEHTGCTYSDVAAKLGMTQVAAKMAAHRFRRRYRELLRDEIGQTVAGPDDVEDEIRNLFATFAI